MVLKWVLAREQGKEEKQRRVILTHPINPILGPRGCNPNREKALPAGSRHCCHH